MWTIYIKQRKIRKILKINEDFAYIYRNELDKACVRHDIEKLEKLLKIKYYVIKHLIL